MQAGCLRSWNILWSPCGLKITEKSSKTTLTLTLTLTTDTGFDENDNENENIERFLNKIFERF